ncbi:M20/M25/M40 family metallo-hydrolase [Candidatus Bathyarchaeota archaeon]|nr:M20/M25/M40 family metallo-hydrolase [Candidatus Bathyarchaeota archaeon]
MMEAVDLLRSLIEMHSPYGNEERIANFLLGFIKGLGYPASIDDAGNIILNPDAELWVATHMDTVDVKRDFYFDGSHVYGTGACDAKGSIAAILLALDKIENLNLGFAIFSMEEGDESSSLTFTEEYKPKTAVVMEPTSLTIADRHYGSLELIVDVKGVSAHGSTPEYGENAIEKALELVEKMKSSNIGEFIVQEISGGGWEYTVPNLCKVRLSFAFPPEIKLKEVERKALKIAESYGEAKVIEEYEGFIASGRAPQILEKAILKAGLKPSRSAMRSWTDAVNLKTAGWDVVVWGPGELRYCHTERESIAVNEVVEASKVIVSLNELSCRGVS